ncbi:MAG: hypothetical protein ACFBSC_17780 [Microcoleaceae cyanobacterium]
MTLQVGRAIRATIFPVVLYCLPILGIAGLIARFGVDLPVADQWVLPKVFEHVAIHRLTFGDLFELHNTHRILFPRIIFISLAFLSNWNIKLEMYFGLTLAVVTFLVFLRIAALSSNIKSRGLFHLANVLTSLLIFSFHQSWLWGFQLPIFLINLCVALACLSLVEPIAKPRLRFPFAGLCCFIASFSSLQGLLTWIATVPVILSVTSSRQRWRFLIIWLGCFVLCCGLYTIGYVREPQTSNLTVSAFLITAIRFFLNLLAAPLTTSVNRAWIIGLVILLSFLFLTVDNLRLFLKTNTFGDAAPWLSIGCFSGLTCVLSTVGRTGLGADYPLIAVRYTTHTILLLIASIQLWRIFIEQKLVKRRLQVYSTEVEVYQNSCLLYGFLTGIICCFIWTRTMAVIPVVQDDLFYAKSSKTCLEIFNYLEDSEFFKQSSERCLRRMSKSTWWIQDGVRSLQNSGLRKFVKNATFEPDTTETYGYIDFPNNTEKVFKVQPNDIIKLSGWAAFSENSIPKEQPQLVFLSYGNQTSFFANAYINLDSPDLVEFFQSNQYRQSRWSTTFLADNLPSGETTIRAWIYEPMQAKFVALKGKVNIQVM